MIDPELAAFVEGGVAIHVGSRNARLEPNGARAAAVRVDADGLHLSVYLAAVAAERLLPDLRANRMATVVFARPVDDRACQIKGELVDARAATPADRGVVENQWRQFLASMAAIGIPRAVTQGWAIWPAVVLRLRASAVFEQTPGPGTGGLFEPRA